MPLLNFTASGDSGYMLGYHSGGRKATSEDFNMDGPSALAKAGVRAVDEVGEAESRKVLVSAAEIRAQYAQRLDDAANSGEDLGKIKEQMNTDLSKVGEGLYTSKGAYELQVHTANSNLMFDQQANAIKVHAAGVQASVEAGKFVNSWSGLINANPAALNAALSDSDAFAATLVHVPPAKRAAIAEHLKSEMNVTAAIAAGRMDPQGTLTKLQGGDWDLTPEQRQHATNAAEAQVRGLRADETNKRALKEYDEREADEKARGETLQGIMGGTMTAKAILADSRLKPTTQEHMINFMDARSRELATQEKASDEEVRLRLWRAVNAPEGDPNKIYNADAIYAAVTDQANGLPGLNTRHADQLMTQLRTAKDENNVSVSSKLHSLSANFDHAIASDPRMLRFDSAQRAEIQNDYIANVNERVEELRKANHSPNDAFDPKNKSYVGSREFMQQSIDRAIAKQTASTPKVVDLRATPQAEVPVGATFVDSKGRTAVMTPEAFAARQAAGKPATSFLGNLTKSDAELKVDQMVGPVGKKPLEPPIVKPAAKQADVPKPSALPFPNADVKVNSSGEWSWLFPDSMQSVPKAEQTKLKKEFDQYKSIAQNGKRSDKDRDSAIKEMVVRAAKLGISMADVEKMIGRPLSTLKF